MRTRQHFSPKCLPFLPLQIPVCIVSKGAVPRTRKEQFTMVQSCHVSLIDEEDFQDIHKNAYPVVVCYNGRDHFTPMRPITQSKFLKWKLNKELGPIVSAALLVIEELDKPKLSPSVLAAVIQLEDSIVQTLPTISPSSLTSHLKAVAACNKAGPLHRGPVLQPGGEHVSSSHTEVALDPTSTATQPSLPDTDQPAEEPPVKRRNAKNMCVTTVVL